MYDISYLTKKKLLDYKMFLIENYRPQTVNLRIRGVILTHLGIGLLKTF